MRPARRERPFNEDSLRSPELPRFQIEGYFGDLDYTNKNAVWRAIDDKGTISVVGGQHQFVLILRDTVTGNSHVYHAYDDIIANGFYGAINGDLMRLVGVIQGANLATSDVV